MSFFDVNPQNFSDKQDLFRKLAQHFKDKDIIEDCEDYVKALNYRESIGSTYMGNEIAIPHGQSATVKCPKVLFCKFSEPFLYKSGEEEGKVRLLFMLAIPENQKDNNHLELLAKLSENLIDEKIVNELKMVKGFEEMKKLTEGYKTEG